jgi:LysM repeat protein
MAAQRPRSLLSLPVLIVGLLVLSAATTGIGIVLGVQSRDGLIDALTLQQQNAVTRAETLKAENDALQSQVTAQQAQITELTQRLDSTYTAVEVGGVVDFPVLRGMARKGDTLASFAKRESTTPAILRALNPWLKDDSTPLQDRQTLWIPKK